MDRNTIHYVLFGMLIVSLGVLFAPRIYTTFFTYIYPSDKAILVNRSFEPDDFSAVGSGGAITATIVVTNNEAVDLHGFYYSDQVPNGWEVNIVDVSVNGLSITDCICGPGYAGEVYPGLTPHRWALEMPQGDGVFSPTHPIPASGGAAQIVYTMIVSEGAGSDYSTGYEGWAGWLETTPVGTAVFGYQAVVTPTNTPTPTNTQPAANFSASPLSGTLPLAVTFTDLSKGDAVAWLWNFGDRLTNTVQHPAHTYTFPDVYTVTLTVTDTESTDSDTIVKPALITVTAPPLEADFTALSRLGLPPLTVEFTDLSVGNILTRAWDFGDGESTTWLPGDASPSVTHTYSSLGCYTVSLVIQDAYTSSTLLKSQYIHVTDVVYSMHLPVILKHSVH